MRVDCRRVVTLIGSRDGCKVCLRDRDVSPAHVAIVHDGSRVLALDLVTPRGTSLNGSRLAYEALRQGDVLTVESWTFRVEWLSPDESPTAREDLFNLEPAPLTYALEHAASKRMLRPNRAVCIVGRRRGCDIMVDDARVSRAHALLMTYQGYPAVFDLLSANGTQVNGEPVGFRLLNDGDELHIGDSRLRVRMVESYKVVADAKPGAAAAPSPSAVAPPDLVDIKETEGSQRWRIAENLEKAARKAKRA
jgi:pSer/pThr/pTyr-binding forkhead associated (FHA) protein